MNKQIKLLIYSAVVIGLLITYFMYPLFEFMFTLKTIHPFISLTAFVLLVLWLTGVIIGFSLITLHILPIGHIKLFLGNIDRTLFTDSIILFIITFIFDTLIIKFSGVFIAQFFMMCVIVFFNYGLLVIARNNGRRDYIKTKSDNNE